MTGQPHAIPPRTLGIIDGERFPTHLQLSLTAACDALRDAPDPLTSISVSGRLTNAAADAGPVLQTAERLAVQHGLGVDMRVDGSAFEIRFLRRAR